MKFGGGCCDCIWGGGGNIPMPICWDGWLLTKWGGDCCIWRWWRGWLLNWPWDDCISCDGGWLNKGGGKRSLGGGRNLFVGCCCWSGGGIIELGKPKLLPLNRGPDWPPNWEGNCWLFGGINWLVDDISGCGCCVGGGRFIFWDCWLNGFGNRPIPGFIISWFCCGGAILGLKLLLYWLWRGLLLFIFMLFRFLLL